MYTHNYNTSICVDVCEFMLRKWVIKEHKKQVLQPIEALNKKDIYTKTKRSNKKQNIKKLKSCEESPG